MAKRELQPVSNLIWFTRIPNNQVFAKIIYHFRLFRRVKMQGLVSFVAKVDI